MDLDSKFVHLVALLFIVGCWLLVVVGVGCWLLLLLIVAAVYQERRKKKRERDGGNEVLILLSTHSVIVQNLLTLRVVRGSCS